MEFRIKGVARGRWLPFSPIVFNLALTSPAKFSQPSERRSHDSRHPQMRQFGRDVCAPTCSWVRGRRSERLAGRAKNGCCLKFVTVAKDRDHLITAKLCQSLPVAALGPTTSVSLL
jgi:hypothetical protein